MRPPGSWMQTSETFDIVLSSVVSFEVVALAPFSMFWDEAKIRVRGITAWLLRVENFNIARNETI